MPVSAAAAIERKNRLYVVVAQQTNPDRFLGPPFRERKRFAARTPSCSMEIRPKSTFYSISRRSPVQETPKKTTASKTAAKSASQIGSKAASKAPAKTVATKTATSPAAKKTSAKTPAATPVAAKTVAAKKVAEKTPAPAATPAEPTHEQISRRAFEIFQKRGHTHGGHHNDWAQAEHELKHGK
jgi:hypothetical protein